LATAAVATQSLHAFSQQYVSAVSEPSW